MSKPYGGTQSVIRAIQLLKLFGGDSAELSLRDVVEASGLNKTTVFRLLNALESEGLLERSAVGGYRLGFEMIRLGGQAIRGNRLREIAHEELLALVKRTGERATLEVPIIEPDGSYVMVIVDEVKGSHLISVDQYIGSRVPIHATSTGKVTLAFMADAERSVALGNTLDVLTDKTVVDVEQLMLELEKIRERGYAVALGELEAGLMATGAPVFNYSGELVGAISTEGPDSRIDVVRLEEIAAEVVVSAENISKRLGFVK